MRRGEELTASSAGIPIARYPEGLGTLRIITPGAGPRSRRRSSRLAHAVSSSKHAPKKITYRTSPKRGDTLMHVTPPIESQPTVAYQRHICVVTETYPPEV